jgi:hypothetical protein
MKNNQISFEDKMKKTFNLIHPKIKAARLVEAAKADVNKYLKRERRRELPEGVDFWDFNCKFGPTDKKAKRIHVTEIGKYIDEAEALESFYVEILAKPGRRTKKPNQAPQSKDFKPVR